MIGIHIICRQIDHKEIVQLVLFSQLALRYLIKVLDALLNLMEEEIQIAKHHYNGAGITQNTSNYRFYLI
jgi:hypothetical protein